MVKTFFRGSLGKWLLDMGRVKIVTTGGLRMHLRKAPLLSSQWGAYHISIRGRHGKQI
jgi:hypothetical protein